MKLSQNIRRRLVSLLRYAAWGCAQSLTACLVFASVGMFREEYFFYTEIVVVGAVSSALTFGGLTAISRKLIWLAFPIAGALVPILLIPVPYLLQCGHLWGCDLRLSIGAGYFVVAALTQIWVQGEVWLGLIAALFYFLLKSPRDRSAGSSL